MERLVDLMAQWAIVAILGGLIVFAVVLTAAVVAILMEDLGMLRERRKNRRNQR